VAKVVLIRAHCTAQLCSGMVCVPLAVAPFGARGLDFEGLASLSLCLWSSRAFWHREIVVVIAHQCH
jgi:hypothetical protein